MSATSFQRMRRIQALKEQCIELGIEGFEDLDESALRELVNPTPETEEEADPEEVDPADEKAELQAKAKALGIKSWHVKSVETLEKEIAELEGE